MNYLVELIIRPTRNKYDPKDLGDNSFNFTGEKFKRIDFENKVIHSLSRLRIIEVIF
jgi:hypothetical protein